MSNIDLAARFLLNSFTTKCSSSDTLQDIIAGTDIKKLTNSTFLFCKIHVGAKFIYYPIICRDLIMNYLYNNANIKKTTDTIILRLPIVDNTIKELQLNTNTFMYLLQEVFKNNAIQHKYKFEGSSEIFHTHNSLILDEQYHPLMCSFNKINNDSNYGIVKNIIFVSPQLIYNSCLSPFIRKIVIPTMPILTHSATNIELRITNDVPYTPIINTQAINTPIPNSEDITESVNKMLKSLSEEEINRVE